MTRETNLFGLLEYPIPKSTLEASVRLLRPTLAFILPAIAGKEKNDGQASRPISTG
jgi:hypothetical protein